MAEYDVAVIGAGCDGLVAAAVLAKRGRKVVVLEAKERAGGRCSTVEFHPGFQDSPVLMASPGLHPEVVSVLKLEKHGYEVSPKAVGGTLLREGEAPLFLSSSRDEATAALAKLNPKDAEGYTRLRAFLDRVIPSLRDALLQEPLPFSRPSLGEVFSRQGAPWRMAARKAWKLRKLGEADLMELLRVAPMSLQDFAEDTFQSEAARALLILPALRGSFLGPYAPGGVANLLFWEALNRRRLDRGVVPKGGHGSLGLAVLRAAEDAGAVVRTNAHVTSIKCEAGRVVGVELASGESVEVAAVVAACDVRQTLLKLIDPLVLGITLRPRLENFRAAGTVARVHYALNSLPPAPTGVDLKSFLQIGASINELEQAFDDAKYGRVASKPWIELCFPTLHDASLAPTGKHVASAWVQHAPHTPLEGDWADLKPALLETVNARIEAHLPGFGATVEAAVVRSPRDLEAEFHLSGGHVFGGELALDQLFTNRPAPSCGRYATPVPGLFLSGGGTHPGCYPTGASGLNAAARVLRDWKALTAEAKSLRS